MKIKNTQELDELILIEKHHEELALYKFQLSKLQLEQEICHPQKYIFQWIGELFLKRKKRQSAKSESTSTFLQTFIESFIRSFVR